MKPKTLILTVVAVVCGLVASFMTTRFLADRPVAEVEEVDVLVVLKNLSVGEIIKDNKVLGMRTVPKNLAPKGAILVPKGALLDDKDIKGKMLKRSLRENECITPEDLYNDKDVLQYNLRDGYRALGIRVTIEGIAGGFAALPHSKVDIISTVKRSDDLNSFSMVLLEDVLVLAADAKDSRDEGARAMSAVVVTVALKPEDVVKVTMAKDMGTLSLALRKFDEKKSLNLAKTTAQEVILGGKAPEIPVKVVEPPQEKKKIEPVARTHRVRLVYGSEVRYLTPITIDDKGEMIEPEVMVTPLSEAELPKEAPKNRKAPQNQKAPQQDVPTPNK